MNTLQKYGWRLLGALGIFAFFQVTTSNEGQDIREWTTEDQAYLVFVVVIVLICWEISDKVVKYFDRRLLSKKFSIRRLFYIFWATTLVLMPLILSANYFSVYVMKVWLECPAEEPLTHFLADNFQATIMAWLVISGQLLKLNFKHVQKAENQAAIVQKELLLSKYEALKNQVNPHFLFNSFSVLSSLIYEDQDLASKFVDQLSKMYRYMLDNRDNQMVSLQKELDFMKAYIFLLKARHEESLCVDIQLDLDNDSFFVPTLSLQILIENAIKHNNFSNENPLTIKIFNEGDHYLVVQNELRAKRHEVQSTKVGLENIKNRYNYQSEKRVIIAESDSHFTVKLPMLTSIQFS